MNAQEINVLIAWFVDKPTQPHQLPAFRSEINSVLNRANSDFHHHQKGSSKTLQQYPKIQFKTLRLPEEYREQLLTNKTLGTIWAINEGVASLTQLLLKLQQNEKYPSLKQGIVSQTTLTLSVGGPSKRYKLNHWLALADDDNFRAWQAPMTMHQRVDFLQKVLYSQIEDFCRMVGYTIPRQGLSLAIYDYKSRGKVKYPNDDHQDIHYEALDIIYEANIDLPIYLGLGKGKSKGFGWQTPTSHHQLLPDTPQKR